MRLVRPAFILALSLCPAMAQDAVEDFQQRAMDAVATPGGTRVPHLCGEWFQYNPATTSNASPFC